MCVRACVCVCARVCVCVCVCEGGGLSFLFWPSLWSVVMDGPNHSNSLCSGMQLRVSQLVTESEWFVGICVLIVLPSRHELCCIRRARGFQIDLICLVWASTICPPALSVSIIYVSRIKHKESVFFPLSFSFFSEAFSSDHLSFPCLLGVRYQGHPFYNYIGFHFVFWFLWHI